jgi:hypothetical protein
MKISDLLSPVDVMIDLRASNKRALLQEFASKAAVMRRWPERTPRREPSPVAKITLPQPGETPWHESTRKKPPPTSSAR